MVMMKLFTGAFVKYERFILICDTFKQVDGNLEAFEGRIQDFCMKGVILRKSGCCITVPDSLILPTNRDYVSESEVEAAFSTSIHDMKALLRYTRSTMILDAGTKRLSYNVPGGWNTCIVCETVDGKDVKVYTVNPDNECNDIQAHETKLREINSMTESEKVTALTRHRDLVRNILNIPVEHTNKLMATIETSSDNVWKRVLKDLVDKSVMNL
jgi:hypothetical protein